MRRWIWLWILLWLGMALNLCAAAPVVTLMVDTNGVLKAPTNFWVANQSAINSVVTGVGGGVAQTNISYTAVTNEPWIENGQTGADLPALTSTNPVFSALRIFDLSSGFPQPGVLMLLPDGTLNQRTQPPGLDLGLATNLPYSGLSETAKTAITNAGAGAVSVSTIQSVMSTNGLGGVALLKASGIVSNFSILADTDDGRGAALSNAFSAAISGDCVYVGSGNYHTASNSPAKDGVNWWLAPGATVYGSRVIDDVSGAKTFSISGAGIFQATNYYATVFLTNLNSLVSIHCKQIRHAGVVAAAGFEVGDAQVTCFAEDSIVSDLYDAVWNASGGWSGQGRVFVHASKIIGGNNGIELDGGQSYISADYVVGGAGGAAPTLNLLGGTNFVHIARIDCTNSTQANRLDGGKNVIVADRIVGGVVYVGGTSLINGATIGGSQLNQPPITSTAADDLTLQNCILDAAHVSTTTSIQGHPTTDHTVKVAGSLSYTADKPPTAHVVLMSPWTQKYIGDGGGLTNLPGGAGVTGMKTNTFTTFFDGPWQLFTNIPDGSLCFSNFIYPQFVLMLRTNASLLLTNIATGASNVMSAAGWSATSGSVTNGSWVSKLSNSATLQSLAIGGASARILSSGYLYLDAGASGGWGFTKGTVPQLTYNDTLSGLWWMNSGMTIAGSLIVTNAITGTNGFIVSSNSWVNQPTLAEGQAAFLSSNGVPHVVWKRGGTLNTNNLNAPLALNLIGYVAAANGGVGDIAGTGLVKVNGAGTPATLATPSTDYVIPSDVYNTVRTNESRVTTHSGTAYFNNLYGTNTTFENLTTTNLHVQHLTFATNSGGYGVLDLTIPAQNIVTNNNVRFTGYTFSAGNTNIDSTLICATNNSGSVLTFVLDGMVGGQKTYQWTNQIMVGVKRWPAMGTNSFVLYIN